MTDRLVFRHDVDIDAAFGDTGAEICGPLLSAVARGHEREAKIPASWRFWVPGRLEVFGKHTDYAGGCSLVAAVPRGIAFAVSPRNDGVVRLTDIGRGQTAHIGETLDIGHTSGWLNYVTVTVRRLRANFPGAAFGADITLQSNLPSAAGMSSSSALIVGVATALAGRADLPNRSEWRTAIHNQLGFAGYLAAIEAGADFGSLVGHRGVGTHGGSEDHTAIVASRPHRLSAYQFVPITWLDEVAMPPDWRFVVAVSGIAADKTGAARDRFNRLSAAARTLIDIWNARRGSAERALGRVLDSGPAAFDELRAMIPDAPEHGFDRQTLARRLDHFVRENERVRLAAEAFRTCDAVALSNLSDASQSDAERLLGNQIEETIALARTAREAGAFAASSFGAGFGGSVWALVTAEEAPQFGTRWIARYQATHPGLGSLAFTMMPGPGMIAVPSS